MLDGFTLDHLRCFVAAAETGSFSAAGRSLGRAQSVISQSIAHLETQLGIPLFTRAGRLPRLTPQGQALLDQARQTTASADSLKARAHSLRGGLEPELSVVIDVMFPMQHLTSAVAAFQTQFPNTPLRLYVEALGAVIPPVRDGMCAFGIIGSLPEAPPGMTTERICGVRMAMVAARTHPLAQQTTPLTRHHLAQHIQLVLTDRTPLTQGHEFGVLSPKTWRLADLGAKYAFLRAGLGWGSMPHNAVAADIEAGHLVALRFEEDPGPAGFIMPMLSLYPAARPPGPAGRWLINHLKAQSPEQL